MSDSFNSLWHSFTMERSGSGFKTVEYRSTINKPIDHHGSELLSIMREHHTLSQIKTNFKDTPYLLICVVEGHYQAPTALIQLIIECNSAETLAKITNHYSKNKSYLMYEYHPEYKWLSDIPKDILNKWLQL
jgi:hypothetical protein